MHQVQVNGKTCLSLLLLNSNANQQQSKRLFEYSRANLSQNKNFLIFRKCFRSLPANAENLPICFLLIITKRNQRCFCLSYTWSDSTTNTFLKHSPTKRAVNELRVILMKRKFDEIVTYEKAFFLKLNKQRRINIIQV